MDNLSEINRKMQTAKFRRSSESRKMEKPRRFVEDWNIIQTLGEGAYGEVKLLVHQVSKQTVALKIIDMSRHKDAPETVKKEERLHSICSHPNIIQLFGKRYDGDKLYIFMEYASGGELFNRIEPDVGMPHYDAQKYMKQLLAGLSYLHAKGIAHRDIKPENLLLDAKDDLKISDFGMATLFRLKGKTRLLDKKCGTLPYVAPELFHGPYHAEPADIWSSGIVFVAMLTGELPWDQPTDEFTEFVQWKKECCFTNTPWKKMDNLALSLARKILNYKAEERPTIEQILQHPWMNTKFENMEKCDDEVDGVEKSAKRQMSLTESKTAYNVPIIAQSQPVPCISVPISENVMDLIKPNRNKSICFSQPVSNEDLLLSSDSDLQFTQTPITKKTKLEKSPSHPNDNSPKNNFSCLIQRMTRFFVSSTCEKTVQELCSALDQLRYNYTTDPSGAISITTVDGRKTNLTFKANIIEMDGKILLDFRLSKGCGLEFKKRFLLIKNLLNSIVLNV